MNIKRYIDDSVKRYVRFYVDGEQSVKRAARQVYRNLLLLNSAETPLSASQLNYIKRSMDLLRKIPRLAELDDIHGKDNAHRAFDEMDMLLVKSGVYKQPGSKLPSLVGDLLDELVHYGRGA